MKSLDTSNIQQNRIIGIYWLCRW